MPSSTSSCASSAHVSRSGVSGVCSPSITTTTSPLSSASPMCDSTSEMRPRITSSWSLVSSRAIAMRRSPKATSASRSRICTRRGDSKTTSVLGSWRSESSRRMRSPGLRGRNPSNVNRSVGRPESTSAASAADGPGTTLHVDPGFDRAVHQAVAGIGDRRHAAVGDERHRAPRAGGVRSAPRCARARCLRRTTPSVCGDPGPGAGGRSGGCPHTRRGRRRPAPREPVARGRPGCRSACPRATAFPPRVQGDTMLSLRPCVEGPGWKDSGGRRTQGLLHDPLVEEARDR